MVSCFVSCFAYLCFFFHFVTRLSSQIRRCSSNRTIKHAAQTNPYTQMISELVSSFPEYAPVRRSDIRGACATGALVATRKSTCPQ